MGRCELCRGGYRQHQNGQTVRFTVDAFAGRNFQGIVKLIRQSDHRTNVVTYDVVINVDNPEQILLPGMTAYVSIAVAERKDVLLVPNAALRFKPPMPASRSLPATSPALRVAVPPKGNTLFPPGCMCWSKANWYR